MNCHSTSDVQCLTTVVQHAQFCIAQLMQLCTKPFYTKTKEAQLKL